MNKNLMYVIAVLAISAAIGMKVMSNNSHTTELANFWWIPLPIALICLIVAGKGKNDQPVLTRHPDL